MPTQNTTCGKVLLALASVVLIGGVVTAVVAPLAVTLAHSPSKNLCSTIVLYELIHFLSKR